MVSTVKQVVGAPVALTNSALPTLAAANYAGSSAYSNTNQQSDLIVELNVTASATTTGNQQAVLYAQASYDGGTTWQTGPTFGNGVTDEPVLQFVGQLPLRSSATPEVRSYSTAAAFGGFLPPMVRFVVKNDCGVAFSAGTMRTMELSYTVG